MVSNILKLLAEEASECIGCSLSRERTQVVFGFGDPKADLMFVGEGPGAKEDEQGLPFVGRSGKLLDRLLLEELNLERSSCYITNVVKCRPPDNRNPKNDEIEACRPFLESQLKIIKPKVIITLGNFSTQLLLDTKVGISKIRGCTYEFMDCFLVPTFHPAAALRGRVGVLENMRSDFLKAKELIDA